MLPGKWKHWQKQNSFLSVFSFWSSFELMHDKAIDVYWNSHNSILLNVKCLFIHFIHVSWFVCKYKKKKPNNSLQIYSEPYQQNAEEKWWISHDWMICGAGWMVNGLINVIGMCFFSCSASVFSRLCLIIIISIDTLYLSWIINK